MFDWLHWFTDYRNGLILSLVLFFVAYCAILIYVFTGKKRAKRLESYKHIPFQDEPDEAQPSRKGTDNERKDT